ncbi:MAG: hypothetical protein COZ76_06915 [Flavobacteriales bacterium CG_4_8_14_3_um_filter_35_10]|nr:hypothetical protein [Zetaproteobacteria bacterium]OIO09928.1 MAG: hypothetical protein AUJ53_07890 [Flavobacteriaceae bacterium CG1_02_35_72]PIR14173.1 MAG: hypothetical protein COV50_04250 [Flavobacteriales bacterium CG11_big_fil_rev_8_21_14_0_20_35_7]PIX06796.1 MAG: hypothetical protein COZ76_06915 [Flavobacteriales bacterium CG_4_8_14_3_um_filter_35_10]
MKKRNLFLGLTLISLVFASCKDENVANAEKTVDSYVAFVDSVVAIDSLEVRTNWSTIDASYQAKVGEAEVALENLKEKEAAQGKIDAGKAKYDAFKAQIEAELEAAAVDSTAVSTDSTAVAQ